LGWGALSAAVVFVGATLVDAFLTFGSAHARAPHDLFLMTVVLVPSVLVGLGLDRRVPDRPVGAALAWIGAAPAAVSAIETWGQTLLGPHPWPGATAMFILKQGVWVWNLTGLVALCLVFPDGQLSGRGWRWLPWLAIAAACFLNAAVSLDPASHRVDGRSRAGYALHLPATVRVPELVLAFATFLIVLAATVASLVVRYRRSGEVARLQLRWLILSASAVPVLLGLGWIAELEGVPVSVWGPAFLLVMLVAVPAAIAIAVLRHDLYDVDRLLGSSVSWLLTSVASAAIFAVTVYSIGDVVGAESRVGVTGAAFITALLLLPVHRLLHERVGRLLDRERNVMLARVEEFVEQVRDGAAEPEQIAGLLQSVLRDPDLQLLFRLPGASEDDFVDVDGRSARPQGHDRIPLLSNNSDVGVIVLGTSSSRRRRQARDAVLNARFPIEVARLRIALRRALEDVRSSRARLLVAATTERRRLERDLHDGAQQQIVAVGMRLRSLQRQIAPNAPAYNELDLAVAALESTVAELRRLAHGVRPSRLEDGLSAALQALAAASPIPVELTVAELALTDVTATTVYFVVAEGLANALKHAEATQLSASVTPQGDGVIVEVRDNGIGGAKPGFGLTSVRDRVAATGGRLTVESDTGTGTSLIAEIACAS